MSVIKQIKDHLNIVDVIGQYIDLQKKGKNYWAICPFHEDSRPSLSVSAEKQMFKCFVCNQGGSVIDFVADFEKIPFNKALNKLADQAGIKVTNFKEEAPQYLPQEQLLINALNDAMNFFQYSLFTGEAQAAQNYANKRGITAAVAEKFVIGYAPPQGLETFLKQKGHDQATLINASLINQRQRSFWSNRLIFGIKNKFNDIIGLSGRSLTNQEPKYINSLASQVFDKSQIFYNINNAWDSASKMKMIYICEGFMDVIAMDKASFPNSVAIMGTALTKAHIDVLKNWSVTLVLDSDVAGLKATLRSIALLLDQRIKTFVVLLPEQKDPDEILHTQGTKELEKLINKKVEGLEFVYQILHRQYHPTTPSAINLFLQTFAKFLSKASLLEYDFYLNKLVHDLQLRKETIVDKIPSPNGKKKTVVANSFQHQAITNNPNFSYILIKSMLKKPMLIKTLKAHPAHFDKAMDLGIVRYIIAVNQRKQAPNHQQFNAQINKIIHDDSIVAYDDPQEFLEVIKLINKHSKQQLIDQVNVKLEKASSFDEKIKLITQLAKLKKRK